MILDEQKVTLEMKVDESYPIYFGAGLFPDIAGSLDDKRKYMIVADSNLIDQAFNFKSKFLDEMKLESDVFIVPAGEQSKTIEMCVALAEYMSEKMFGRNTTILAIGGGVTGDISGFVASMFCRGISYIQIPTTLLSQVDSSIGGKTAVNTKYGKNLLGTFKQPEAVYIDFSLLKTLPDKEFWNGMAEVVKYGVIQNAGLFEKLESLGNNELKEREALEYIIKECCRIKARVVEQDPNEKGLRRILNYGHTVGHAVEKLSGFRLSHGECVSIGMMAEGLIAKILSTGFKKQDLQRQRALLEKFSLPVTIPQKISTAEILIAARRDKKAEKSSARYCLPRRIGEMHGFSGKYAMPIDEKVVKKVLDETR